MRNHADNELLREHINDTGEKDTDKHWADAKEYGWDGVRELRGNERSSEPAADECNAVCSEFLPKCNVIHAGWYSLTSLKC